MVVIESYGLAVVMCVVTMLCWGSWANTQKLASKEWRFQLFYWDYSIGVLLLTIILAFTMGSMGSAERSFMNDLSQANGKFIGSALLGGAIFNVANILLVAAIDIAGLAVAFPVGIGIALVWGVITTYIAKPAGDPTILFLGVAFVAAAILINAAAYKRLPATGQKTTAKGLVISIVAGVLMGFFYRFVAAAIANLAEIDTPAEAGKLTPYTALVFFALGLFLSSFVLNTIAMKRPFVGDPVPLGDYFKKGNPRLHMIGIIGGMIWSVGMSFSILAGDTAGYAISYGLGQGATMVAAAWGVFIWHEFKTAPPGTNKLLGLMFACFIVGLGLIVYANVAETVAEVST
ncbi:MAG TPA: GRP family sugar transporter [Phycisphaerae bacterium]|nr:GRP family sugar transporter [Phycisphaerae bacterium]